MLPLAHYFASRGAMDVRGLGYERVQKLLDAKLIATVADLKTVMRDAGYAEGQAQSLALPITSDDAPAAPLPRRATALRRPCAIRRARAG